MTLALSRPPDGAPDPSCPNPSPPPPPSRPCPHTVRVAIIGAGASGLVQLKQLLDAFNREDVRRQGKNKLEVVCFEKSTEVGGVWHVDTPAGTPKGYQTKIVPGRSVGARAEDENGEAHRCASGHANGRALSNGDNRCSEGKGRSDSDSDGDGDGDGAQSSAGSGGHIGPDKVYAHPLDGESPSPMYDALNTNLPHDLMAFREFPAPYTPTSPSDPLAISYPESYCTSSTSTSTSTSTALPSFHGYSRLFPPRSEVQAYLEAYAEVYDLRRHIRFRTRVERLYRPLRPHVSVNVDGEAPRHEGTGTAPRRWRIHSRPVPSTTSQARVQAEEAEEVVEDFDYVCCANGHYADTWIPEIVGLGSFPGTIMHSRFFRTPEPFAGKRVVVVGSYASGGDIARILAEWSLRADTDTSKQGLATATPAPPSAPAPKATAVSAPAPSQARMPSPPLDNVGAKGKEHPDPDSGTDPESDAHQSSRYAAASVKAANGHEDVYTATPESASKGPIDVHISCSAPTAHSPTSTDACARYITYRPRIARVEGSTSTVVFEDGARVGGVDVLLFATGYNYALPFCRRGVWPWSGLEAGGEERDGGDETGHGDGDGHADTDMDGRMGQGALLDETIRADEWAGPSGSRSGCRGTAQGDEEAEEAEGAEDGERGVGGMRGLSMHALDPLLLFPKGDRTFALPALQYQVVPFTLAEAQARLIALLWAGVLDLPPDEEMAVEMPLNASNPYSTLSPTAASTTASASASTPTPAAVRDEDEGALPKRGLLQFGAEHEWAYTAYLLRLMLRGVKGNEEGEREGKGMGVVEGREPVQVPVPEYWKKVEGWRMARRADGSLRRKVVGY